ncbi:MAG: NAD(P)/FAD-dependent oxidoreductase [Leptothrix sp. (in: b-proteobacteria)]
MERIDCAVRGAGGGGRAGARARARAGREVIVLEAADAFGTATSARNSEVIHAGLYYPSGSLKAQLCVQGRALLYDFCARHQVAHRRIGKLLVATDPAQHAKLAALQAQARANGVHDLQWLDAAQAAALEPALRCTAALLSPSTGIIDSHGLMLALLADAEAHGALLALRTAVQGGRATPQGIELRIATADGEMTVRARSVINAAGLWAPALARRLGLPVDALPLARFCKGNYFACSGKAAFSRLIYPLPDAAGLGVHVTLDLAGQMRFGPDTEWIEPAAPGAADAFPPADALDYRVEPQRVAGMADAIRRYWPGLPDEALAPAYAGVRPKISGALEAAADFRIDGPAQHGVAGLVNLFGIESPGLTASLAIAERVAAQVQEVTPIDAAGR